MKIRLFGLVSNCALLGFWIICMALERGKQTVGIEDIVIQFLLNRFILSYRFTQSSLIRPYGMVELIFSLCQFMANVVLEKFLNKFIILMVHLELEETNSFKKLRLMQMFYFCLVFAYVFPK